MKLFLIILIGLSIISCQKKKYAPYIGSYEGELTEHLDSNNYLFDTVYTSVEDVIELDNKNMQFRDLPIPYKFIDKNGYFADENFFTGIIWGRQITLRNDSVIYYHHESTADFNWYLRFRGKRL